MLEHVIGHGQYRTFIIAHDTVMVLQIYPPPLPTVTTLPVVLHANAALSSYDLPHRGMAD